MATKPITSFTFATDANFGSGPASGFPVVVIPPLPAQGHVPGDGVVAEYVNYHTNILGEYTVWVLAGSSAAGLDAHIVETDANGDAALAQLDVGGTANATIALRVSQNTGADSAAGTFTNSGAGFGVTSTAASTLAGIRGTNTGTGAGVEGIGLGTNNVGVVGQGQGTAAGGSFTGGATGPGIIATGGATADYGALCTGTGAFAGVSGIGGASATEAVLGTASWNEQMGVRGVAHASGLASGGGVIGVGQGDAPGVRSTATNGYGVIAGSDTSSPTRASFRVVPQDADPGTALMGDVTHRSDLDIQRVYTDSIWQSPWSTASGIAFGLAAPRASPATSTDATAYVTLVTATTASPYEPRFAGGFLLLLASCRFGNVDSANPHRTLDIRILDNTSGAIVYNEIVQFPATDAADNNTAVSQWTIMVPYSIPAAGSRQFTLEFRCGTLLVTGAVGDVASLAILGVFG
jgi:hypothetical protein